MDRVDFSEYPYDEFDLFDEWDAYDEFELTDEEMDELDDYWSDVPREDWSAL